jgi:hypothetical protein
MRLAPPPTPVPPGANNWRRRAALAARVGMQGSTNPSVPMRRITTAANRRVNTSRQAASFDLGAIDAWRSSAAFQPQPCPVHREDGRWRYSSAAFGSRMLTRLRSVRRRWVRRGSSCVRPPLPRCLRIRRGPEFGCRLAVIGAGTLPTNRRAHRRLIESLRPARRPRVPSLARRGATGIIPASWSAPSQDDLHKFRLPHRRLMPCHAGDRSCRRRLATRAQGSAALWGLKPAGAALRRSCRAGQGTMPLPWRAFRASPPRP